MLLDLLPLSPAEFVVRQSANLESFFYDNWRVDIEGALRGGQPGMAFRACRSALDLGIAAFLKARGHGNVSFRNKYHLLALECGTDSEAYRQALALEHANPLTLQEVAAHAEQARHFVEETLGVRPPAFLWGYNHAGDNAAYNQRIDEVEPLARFLGMESPFPVTRLARFISGVSDPGTTMVSHTRNG